MAEEEKNYGVAMVRCTLKELCINECLQISVNWGNVVKQNGTKFLHNNVRN